MQACSVSVVIPCYKYGWCLRECMESVLGQRGVDVRVLIIDDASTDDSAQVAEALAAADARVEVRRHAVNLGHIITYNEGMRWAAGRYTVLLDADDMLTPGALERACALLEAHPEVGFVYGAALVFGYGRARRPPCSGPGRWRVWPGRRWFEARCQTTENCIRSPEVVLRTSLLRQVGGYREELPHAADFEMWMRLALHADVGYIAGPHQAYYRDHATGMHRQRFATPLADLTQVRDAFAILFCEHARLIADRERLETLVNRTLAQRALQAACRAYDRGQPDPTEVAGLVELAVATGDAPRQLRALERRQRLGPYLCRMLRPFRVMSHLRRLRQAVRRRRMWRSGL